MQADRTHFSSSRCAFCLNLCYGQTVKKHLFTISTGTWLFFVVCLIVSRYCWGPLVGWLANIYNICSVSCSSSYNCKLCYTKIAVKWKSNCLRGRSVLASSLKITFYIIASQLSDILSGFREEHWKYDVLKREKNLRPRVWLLDLVNYVTRGNVHLGESLVLRVTDHMMILVEDFVQFLGFLDWNQVQLKTTGDKMQSVSDTVAEWSATSNSVPMICNLISGSVAEWSKALV